MFEHVVIVGGGFSGAMLAVNLLRGPGPRVTLVERGPAPALGLAYGAAHQSHLLNVRAGNMSAFPDEPGHFAAWLAERGQADAAAAFAPRPVYGAYLQELLAEAQRREGARLAIVNASAIALETSEGGASVTLEDGRRIQADAAALATGNLPPHPPRGLDPRGLSPGRYWGDPWAPGVAGGLQRTDRVLIIGTGLTMVDVALLLDASGFTGRIDAISRRGLLPHAHAAAAPPDRPRQQAPATLPSALLREVRARGEAIGWRQAVDELRPFTQKMWRAASDPERGRFLRHLRPWWDVHRHRIAPAVHERIQAMIDCGRLVPAAGKLISFKDAAEGVEVSWRPRGSEATQRLTASRVINCTGPEGNLPASGEPLLRSLLASGTIRPGPVGLGVDVDPQSRVVGSGGRANERLYALGPPTRGAFWEIVAVPDIRVQAQAVARRLACAE